MIFSSKPRRRGVDVSSNGDFFDIATFSGYVGPTKQDYRGLQVQVLNDVSDGVLGSLVLEGLARSRFVTSGKRGDIEIDPDAEIDPDFFDYKKSSQRYEEWVASLMSRFNYKSRKQLFKRMKVCSIWLEAGMLTISPMRHRALEAWEGLDSTENFVIDAAVSMDQIGAAVRIAFGRCT